MDPDHQHLSWPVGESEMAVRIRALDWSRTPLGPVAGWPQSLKTVVDLVLASPSMMSLVWGEEAIHVYNDHFAELLREHRVTALGRSAFETFARSRDVFAADVAAGLSGRSARLPAQRYPVLRNGRLEDAWFDVDYAPVRDETGTVAGVLWTLKETTAQVLSEQALRESEARQGLLIGSWAQAVWETDAEGVVVADSPSWRAYTGQTLGEWLGYGWLSAIHPDDRAYAELHWREAVAARGLVDAEFRLRAADGGWRWTNVRAAPVLDADGGIARWAGMNIDIDARKQAEAALRESEGKFRTLFESIDEGFCLLEYVDDLQRSSDYRFVDVNEAFETQTGLTGVVGKLGSEVSPHAEDYWIETYAEVARTGVARRVENHHEETGRWYDVFISRVGGEGSRRICLVFNDTTDRKRAEATLRESEERQAFLLKLSDAVRPLAEPADIQGETTRLLREQLNAAWCHYVDWDLDSKTGLVLRDSAGEGRPSLAGMHDASEASEFLRLLAVGAVLTVRDYAGYEPLPVRIRQKFTALGFRSMMAAPLVKESRLIATLIVGDTEVRDWSAGEASLLVEVAERSWAAFERARAEAALRASQERHRVELERQVEEATTELKTSRHLLQATLDASTDMIQVFEAVRNEAGEIVDFNWILNNHTSASRYGEVRGESLLTRNPGVVVEGIFDAFKRVTETGVSEQAEHHYVHERLDGWFYQSVVKLNDGVATTTKEISDWKRDQADVLRLKEEAAAAKLRESEERLHRFGEASTDILWIRDAETLRWTYLTPAFEEIYGLSREEALTGNDFRRWTELILPEDREAAFDAIRRVRAGEHVTFEYRIRRPKDGSIRHVRDTDFPIRDAGGGIRAIGGVGHDVTEERAMEERQKILFAELQHRTRNLIGVVRAMADRTAGGSATLEAFLPRFRERLGALSRINSLLSKLDSGERVTFDELLRSELDARGILSEGDKAERVMLDGPAGVRLRSASVQTFALAIHELVTNAVKYGALADGQGRLCVLWRLRRDEAGIDRLQVEWIESGVPDMPREGDAPRGGGYGRMLIERALPYQLNARTTYELGRDGVRCTIDLPLR